MKSVNCPTCQTEVIWNDSAKFKPFCSERCKLIDLGEWFDEKNRIPDQNPAAPFIAPDKDSWDS